MNSNNGWTEERRAKQSKNIQKWKPWQYSTGAITNEGKERSKMNAQRVTPNGLLRKMNKVITYRNKALSIHGLTEIEKLEYLKFRQNLTHWLALPNKKKYRTLNN